MLQANPVPLMPTRSALCTPIPGLPVVFAGYQNHTIHIQLRSNETK